MKSQPARARRAAPAGADDRSAKGRVAKLIEAPKLILDQGPDRRSWLRHGVAGLAISALGLVVAGSVVMTGAAENSGAGSATSTRPSASGSLPPAFDQRATGTNRDALRQPLDGDTIDPKQAAAAQAAAAKAQKQGNAKSTSTGGVAKKAADKRKAELKDDTSETKKFASELERAQQEREQARQAAANANSDQGSAAGSGSAAPAGDTGSAPSSGDGKPSLPITSGYSVAARFGQVGAWARYHTGFDFSTPIGTPIHAAADGTVTNAGPNGEAGWAGTYVTIKHSDGTQTLYAHMANTAVHAGEKVSGGQVIGHVGMTGRSFGPHVHFEVYPAGVTPGDVYKAVNPQPWLEKLGLHP